MRRQTKAMKMFQILILTCAMSISPADCQADNAVDMIRGPEVTNELMCGFHGQAFLASTSLAPRPGREYVKIQCLRRVEAQDARVGPENPPSGGPDSLISSAAAR
jgi:hypothetical protein